MQKENKNSETETEESLENSSAECISNVKTDSFPKVEEVAELASKFQEDVLETNFFPPEKNGTSVNNSTEMLAEKLEKLVIREPVENRRASRKKITKTQPRRLTLSVNYEKYGRKMKARKLFQGVSRIKQKSRNKTKSSSKNKLSLETNMEIPKKGKRGQLGGKAIAKPPAEATEQKGDSDEEIDYFYFNRISLGQFQKLRDDSGASTSNQHDSIASGGTSMYLHEETLGPTPEESELLELEEWGRSFFISSSRFKTGKYEE